MAPVVRSCQLFQAGTCSALALLLGRIKSEPRIKQKYTRSQNQEILKWSNNHNFSNIYIKISKVSFQFQIYFCPILAHPIGVSNLNLLCAVCLINNFTHSLSTTVTKLFPKIPQFHRKLQHFHQFNSCSGVAIFIPADNPRPLFESRLKLLSHPLPIPVPFSPAVVLLTLVTGVP